MTTDLTFREQKRIDTENEVKTYLEEEKKKALASGEYTITGYSSRYKEKLDRKTKEVVDSGYLVTIEKTYNTFWEA